MSYVTESECDMYMGRLRRPPRFTTEFRMYGITEEIYLAWLKGALFENRKIKVNFNEWYGEAFVVDINVGRGIDIAPKIKVTFQATGAPRNNFDITTHNIKEDRMKVFEAIVVKINAEGTPESVVKQIFAFTALTAQAARDQVLFDYAQEQGIAGKDLTGYQVRTREFLSGQNSYV